MITPSKEFWKVFKETQGALSCSEAIAIMNIAAQAPKGAYMELGTHKGKSAMAACVGLGEGAFNLVEPEFSNQEWVVNTIASIKKVASDKIYLNTIADYSTNVIDKAGKYCYVFVDSGSHGDGLPMQEVKMLEDRMVQGGIIAFHDYKSQFVEVHQAYDYLVSTGKYEPIPINWQEIIDYVNADNLEEGNSSWHHTEMRNPNFVGAVRRK